MLIERLAQDHADSWQALHDANHSGPYQADADGMARRVLKATALGYLLETLSGEAQAALLVDMLGQADNLTDRLAALHGLCNSRAVDQQVRDNALTTFYERFAAQALVVNQWFAVQAGSRLADAGAVAQLAQHPAYDQRNPNKVRSVFSVFAQANARNFHARDGGGYHLLADRVLELDATNPQIAARLCTPLTRWRRFDAARARLMQGELQRLSRSELSKDLYEVVTKGLE